MAIHATQERTGIVTLRGAPITLVGAAVKAGDRAPDFAAAAADLSRYTLENALAGGRRAALLIVVPSLDTGVCSKETALFNQRVDALPQDAIASIGISMDLPFAQKRWAASEGIERITLVSDYKERSFGLAYGVYMKENGLLARSIFVVDKNGIVRYVEIVPEMASEPDYEKALAAARSAAA